MTAVTAAKRFSNYSRACWEGLMSSALLEMEEVVTTPPSRSEGVQPAKAKTIDQDKHPLLPIFIAGAIAFATAVMFISSILARLALRHSGVMAP